MAVANNRNKLKISKFYLYTTMSILYVIYMVQTSFETHGQFFPSIVNLSMNKWFGIVLANGMFAAYLLVVTTLFRVCFGKIQANDRRKLNEFLGLHIVDVLMALSYFRNEVSSVFAGILFINGAARCYHHMAATQQDTMEETGQAPKKQVIRLTCLLSVMFALDTLYLGFCINKVMRDGHSVWMLMAMEAVTMTFTALATLMKLLLNQIEAYKGKIWQSKGTLKFYVDLAHEFCSSVVYVIFFATQVKHQGNVPLHLIRELIFNFRRFSKTVGQFLRYRRMAATLESKFPDATPEELDVDRNCAICYDEMEDGTKAKKLPCGHCFHYHCLRRWVEKQTACPYCWQELEKKQDAAAPPAAAAAPIPAPAPAAPAAAGANGNAAPAPPAGGEGQDDEALMQAAYMAYMQMHAEAQKAQKEKEEKEKTKKEDTAKKAEDKKAAAPETKKEVPPAAGASDEVRPEPTKTKASPPIERPPTPPLATPAPLATEVPATPVEGLGRKSKLFSQPSTPASTTTKVSSQVSSPPTTGTVASNPPPAATPLVVASTPAPAPVAQPVTQPLAAAATVGGDTPARAKLRAYYQKIDEQRTDAQLDETLSVWVGREKDMYAGLELKYAHKLAADASPTPEDPSPVAAPPAVATIPPMAASMSWERTGTRDREEFGGLETQSQGGTSSMGGFSTQSNLFDIEELNAHQEYQDDIRRAQKRLDERVSRLAVMRREGSAMSTRGTSSNAVSPTTK